MPEKFSFNPLSEKEPKLHATAPVEQALKRREKQTGERIGRHDKSAMLNVWMADLEKIHIDRDPQVAERIKQVYYEKYVIKPNEIPESYFELQKRIARERGHGDTEITPDIKQQLENNIIVDQKKSLDEWIEYLSSSDAGYPMWFKYYAFTNIVKLSTFDKEKGEFRKRAKGTTNKFPTIYRGALARVADAMADHYGIKDGRHIFNPKLKELLDQDANFAKLYANEMINAPKLERRESTSGEWKVFKQGSDPEILAKSVQGTDWCTEGVSTAENQLNGGEFHVYFTEDASGDYTIPRIAIRMEGESIAEVRGVDAQQNLEPAMVNAAKSKLGQMPDGQKYEKKTSDMQTLTAIENKTAKGKELSSQELRLLYELDSKIEGFGYQKDPRIAELRASRNPEADMPILFECSKNQIARKPEGINENTVAYVGKLVNEAGEPIPKIFDKIAHLEHIYTSFPEGKITLDTVMIGGKTKDQLEDEIKKAGMQINIYAKSMIDIPDFVTLSKAEKVGLVRLKVRDLGFTQNPTTEQLYERAEKLGLELVPPETGPHYRLKYTNQPLNEWLYMGMEQIADRHGSPSVFGLRRGGDGLWLSSDWAGPTDAWSTHGGFVFRLRKLES